ADRLSSSRIAGSAGAPPANSFKKPCTAAVVRCSPLIFWIVPNPCPAPSPVVPPRSLVPPPEPRNPQTLRNGTEVETAPPTRSAHDHFHGTCNNLWRLAGRRCCHHSLFHHRPWVEPSGQSIRRRLRPTDR